MNLDRIEKAVLLTRAAFNETLTEEEGLVVKDCIFKLTKASTRRQLSTRLNVSVHYDLWDVVMRMRLEKSAIHTPNPEDNHEIDITFTYDRGLVVTVRSDTFIHTALLKSSNVATDIEQVTYNYVDAMRLMMQGKAVKNQSQGSSADIDSIKWVVPRNDLSVWDGKLERPVYLGSLAIVTYGNGGSVPWNPTASDISSEEWIVVN